MILRRVVEHLRQQHWTAIGIELVIVVLGVFIGTQVSNWNDDRIERNLARGDLSQIAADLRSQVEFQRNLESSAKMRIAAVDYIHQQAFGIRLPTTLRLATETWKAPAVEPFPPGQMDNLLGSVNLVRVSQRSRNAYQSLISSGRMAQLQNRALVAQLQAYYGEYDDMLTTATMLRGFRNDGVRDQYPLGLSIFDERPAAEIVALAHDNPGFAAYLRTQREWAILHYNLLHALSPKTDALLKAIDEEIAEP
jgi:hypothetical protein